MSNFYPSLPSPNDFPYPSYSPLALPFPSTSHLHSTPFCTFSPSLPFTLPTFFSFSLSFLASFSSPPPCICQPFIIMFPLIISFIPRISSPPLLILFISPASFSYFLFAFLCRRFQRNLSLCPILSVSFCIH